MEYDISTLVSNLNDASIDIEGMSFPDAYETVFTCVTDMFAAANIPVEGDILHACQDATAQYLDNKHIEESSIVTTFLNKLDERNGLSIAASADIPVRVARAKLLRKYGIKSCDYVTSTTVDDEKLKVYSITDNNSKKEFYGKAEDGTLFTLDTTVDEKEVPNMVVDHYNYSRAVANAMARDGEDPYDYMHEDPVFKQDGTKTEKTTRYQVNSVVDKNDKVNEIIRAFDYLESDESYKSRRLAASAKSAETTKEFNDALKLIHVDITDASYKDIDDLSGDAMDNADDGSLSAIDEDASFDITLKFGEKELAKVIAYASLSYSGFFRGGYVDATYDDPGYTYGSGELEFESLDGDTVVMTLDDNDFTPDMVSDLIPEGRFRDLFMKHWLDVIDANIHTYIEKNNGHSDIDY